MRYVVDVWDTEKRGWVACQDCDARLLRDAIGAAVAEVGAVWKIRDTKSGAVKAHGDATGRVQRIADLPLPLTERLLLWVQREFNPKHVQRVYADLVDVATGNRAGNAFECAALALLS